MEDLIIYGVAFLLAVVVLYALCVYVIFPIAGIISIIGLAAGVGISLFLYVRSAIEYANPYALPGKVWTRTAGDVFVDGGRRAEPSAKRRSYFFGPGFYSLWKTWITSWKCNFDVVRRYHDWFTDKCDDILSDGLALTLRIAAWISLIALSAALLVVGGAVSIGVGLLHGALMMAVAIPVYLVFSILYGVDYFYLWRHSIRSICPTCKKRYVIPWFACSNPACGKIHRRLIPSAYGVTRRECVCGAVLPTTFFGGRNMLTSYCPYCMGEKLASAESRQFCVSMIGGSASGKTTLLASYLHRLQGSAKASGLTVEVPEGMETRMNYLEQACLGKRTIIGTSKRVEGCTDPYTLLLKNGALAVSRQMNFFDVAGEIFLDPTLRDIVYGADFMESEGIALVVDPLWDAHLREEAVREGMSASAISTMDPADVVNNLANYIRQNRQVQDDSGLVSRVRQLGRRSGARITRPIAVVVTKADVRAVAAQITNRAMEEEAGRTGEPLWSVRNRTIRDFLLNNGMQGLLQALDANFSRQRYFLISATGGVTGAAFVTDAHVEEPVNWLIRACGDQEFADAMGVPRDEGEAS